MADHGWGGIAINDACTLLADLNNTQNQVCIHAIDAEGAIISDAPAVYALAVDQVTPRVLCFAKRGHEETVLISTMGIDEITVSGTFMRKVTTERTAAWGIAYSRHHDLVFTHGLGNDVTLTDYTTGDHIRRILTDSGLRRVRLSADGVHMVVAGHHTDTVSKFRVDDGTFVSEFRVKHLGPRMSRGGPMGPDDYNIWDILVSSDNSIVAACMGNHHNDYGMFRFMNHVGDDDATEGNTVVVATPGVIISLAWLGEEDSMDRKVCYKINDGGLHVIRNGPSAWHSSLRGAWVTACAGLA
jgi:hypothetical protein